MKLKKVKIKLAKQLLQIVKLLILLRKFERKQRHLSKRNKKIIKMCQTISSFYECETNFIITALEVISKNM